MGPYAMGGSVEGGGAVGNGGAEPCRRPQNARSLGSLSCRLIGDGTTGTTEMGRIDSALLRRCGATAPGFVQIDGLRTRTNPRTHQEPAR